MTKGNPLVSIISITYNHEPFIAKTIEGVLMQQVNFPMEFIIAEDCSIDRTREIVLDYANRNPELIKVITSNTNVGAVANEHRAMLQSKGKYIAFCEGDDYWTDPLKLQKQVYFLETNPDYSVCFHRCKHYNIESNVLDEDICGQFFTNQSIEGVDITREMFCRQWITQPLTMVYKREALNLDISLKYKYYRDMHQIYHLLEAGKGYLFAFDGGVRIIHKGGIHSMISIDSFNEMALKTDKEFYIVNFNDNYVKAIYADTLQNAIYDYAGKLRQSAKAFGLSIKLVHLTKNFGRFLRNIRYILRNLNGHGK